MFCNSAGCRNCSNLAPSLHGDLFPPMCEATSWPTCGLPVEFNHASPVVIFPIMSPRRKVVMRLLVIDRTSPRSASLAQWRFVFGGAKINGVARVAVATASSAAWVSQGAATATSENDDACLRHGRQVRRKRDQPRHVKILLQLLTQPARFKSWEFSIRLGERHFYLVSLNLRTQSPVPSRFCTLTGSKSFKMGMKYWFWNWNAKKTDENEEDQFYRVLHEKWCLDVSWKHSKSHLLKQGFIFKILRTSLKMAKHAIYAQCFWDNFWMDEDTGLISTAFQR